RRRHQMGKAYRRCDEGNEKQIRGVASVRSTTERVDASKNTHLISRLFESLIRLSRASRSQKTIIFSGQRAFIMLQHTWTKPAIWRDMGVNPHKRLDKQVSY